MTHGIVIMPSSISLSGQPKLLPFDSLRAFTGTGEHRFASGFLPTPELEPELTADETIGVVEDGPRKPLPRSQVIANLAALRASEDPALQAVARSFTGRDYDRAVAEYDRWEIRQ